MTDFNDGITWIAALMVSAVLCFLGYLGWRLSNVPKRLRWRYGLRAVGIVSTLIGAIRLVVVFAFFQTPEVKPILPITSMIAWLTVGVVSYMFVRYVESACERIAATRKNIEFTNEVFDQIVRPIINGNPVPMKKLEEYQAKSSALAA